MVELFPYIFSEDAKKQAEFYVNALDGEILVMKTFGELLRANNHIHIRDKIMYLRFKAVGQVFLMSDLPEGFISRGNGMALSLRFLDEAKAQKAFDNLVQGGNVIIAFEKQLWGSSSSGIVEDPFGVRWQIETTC
jgi:PhnB protein